MEKLLGEIKRFCENKAKYWYIIFAIFVVSEILNYGFLNIVVPVWICHIISFLLIAVGICYLAIIYNYLQSIFIDYMTTRSTALFTRIDNMQKHIDELDKKNTELKNALAENLKNAIKENSDNTNILLKSEFNRQRELDENNTSELKKQMSSFETEFTCNIKEISNLSDKNTDKLKKDIKIRLDEQKEHISAVSDKIGESVNDFAAQSSSRSEQINSELILLHSNIEKKADELYKTTDNNINKIQTLFDEQNKKNSDINKCTIDEINILREFIGNLGDKTNTLTADATEKILSGISNTEQIIGNKTDEFIEIRKTADEEIKNKIQDVAAYTSEKLSALKESLVSVKDSIDNNSNNVVQTIRAESETLESKILEGINNSDINNAEGLQEVCDALKSEIVSGINNISVDIKKTEKAIKDVSISGLERLSQEMIDHKEKDIKSFETNISLLRSIDDRMENLKLDIENRMNDISENMSEAQDKLTALINQLLDIQEEEGDKLSSNYNMIFDMLIRLSTDTKTHISELHNYNDFVKQMAEQLTESLTTSNIDNSERANNISNAIDTYFKIQENGQKEVYLRLDSFNDKITNLNIAIETVKNMLIVQSNVQRAQKNEDKTNKEAPDRTEEIRDSDTGITIFNNYKNNKLVSSEMRNGKQKSYELEYQENGSIKRSINYDADGRIIEELYFHPNGQVKTRIETTYNNGKTSRLESRFDEKSNKIK